MFPLMRKVLTGGCSGHEKLVMAKKVTNWDSYLSRKRGKSTWNTEKVQIFFIVARKKIINIPVVNDVLAEIPLIVSHLN